MNLEKRIKRHVIGRRHTFFAVTLPGFEDHCRLELASLSDTLTVEKTALGGILFSGRLTDLYRANLHSRTAGRILLRLDVFKATNFHQLVQKTKAFPWALFLPSGAVPSCKVTARHSRLYHSQAIAQRINQGISDYWREMGTAPGHANDQTLFVRLDNDVVTLSLDSSGDNLYRRGLKRHGARAPLRETTAAIILLHAGYRPDMPLMDPMCGAGTFSLEAALMAKHIPPGMQRDFAFMQWPAFKPQQWNHLKKKAAQQIIAPPTPFIRASDLENSACSKLHQCIEQNHLTDAVEVSQKDFFHVDTAAFPHGPGLVAINPPFGRRLTPARKNDDLNDFYQRLLDKLHRDFPKWRIALLGPKNALKGRLGFQLKRNTLVHGGLSLTLVTGKLGSH